MRRIGPIAAVVLGLATLVVFRPVVDFGFLNWDDPDVVAANPRLQQPLGARIAWAFSTREMGHYQPLSWLALATVAGTPPSPARVHGAALALHALNAVLLFWLIAVLLDRGDRDPARWLPALAGAALFAVHPLRAEPVAWASALPYVLSYAPLLAAVGAWLTWLRRGGSAALAASVALFAVSQLTRVTAPLLPMILIAIARTAPGARPLPWRTLFLAALPFAAIAVPLAIVEAGARDAAPLAEIGVGPRIAWTVVHPVLYVWQTLTGGPASPMAAMPRAPQPDWSLAAVALGVGLAAVVATARAWSWRAAIAVWGSYLALLAPVVGLAPSGLQVLASRYTYGPAMALSIGLAAAVAGIRGQARRAVLGLAAVAVVVLAVAARAAVADWRDSTTLWSAALAADADNDVAQYNLALALVDTGDAEGAAGHLERLLARVPDHDLARTRLAALRADREQRAADAAANAGRLADAVAAYTRVLAHDPGRVRARLNRGMALARLGDLERAGPDLEAGGAASSPDPAVAAALALAWSQTGRDAEAIALLSRMRRSHPQDLGLSMNLARLLLTSNPPSLRDPATALDIAAGVNDATGGRDPRVLATLAEALAATGRRRDAAEAWDAAASQAAEAGDGALATELRRRRAAMLR